MSQKRVSKPKKVVRGKEELLAELRQDAAWVERMDFTKNKFWPALVAASTSIEDATILVDGFYNQIMTEYLSRMNDLTLGDLKLVDKLEAANEKHAEHKVMVELFNDMPLPQAKQLIEGMKSEIETFRSDWSRTHTLNDLPVAWLDD